MNKLRRFFTENWAINRNDLEGAASLLLPCLVKGNITAAVQAVSAPKCNATATGFPYMAKWYELDDATLPEGSVAIVRLNGMLYVWETEWLIEVLKQAESNPRICGIVLEIDGPGGMASKVEQAAAAIKNCTKPTATVVTGMMASAHFWIGTAADRTFVASPLCEVGSVGVVFTYYSFREFFKINGIDYRQIYPDTADLKNEESRAIEDKDDESLLKAHGERIHKVFAETVAENIGIPYDPKLEIYRGRMFAGDAAVAAGYIDAMGSVDDAVAWVLAQATQSQLEGVY